MNQISEFLQRLVVVFAVLFLAWIMLGLASFPHRNLKCNDSAAAAYFFEAVRFERVGACQ